MKKLLTVLTIAVVLVPPLARTQTTSGVVQAGEGQVFAARLFAKFPHDTNLLFSPTSVRLALGMALAGARGDTATEMTKALALSGNPRTAQNGLAKELRDLAAAEQQQQIVRVVNRVWGQTGRAFESDYLALLQRSYGAPFGQLDFKNETEKSRVAINKFIEAKTERKIKELIPPGSLNDDVRLVVTNAVYFKASWAMPFPEEATRDDWFHISASKAVRAKLMSNTQVFKYAMVGGAQLLEIPYASGRMSMVIVLPVDRSGLGQVEQSMNDQTIASWVNALKIARVKVTLPRFTMTNRFELSKILASMGMRSAFDPRTADFSGIDGTRELYIDQAIHKAFMAVDEKGTEAAAATALTLRVGGLAPTTPPIEFRADHPFVFFVRDVTVGSVLFMGRVVEPKSL